MHSVGDLPGGAANHIRNVFSQGYVDLFLCSPFVMSLILCFRAPIIVQSNSTP